MAWDKRAKDARSYPKDRSEMRVKDLIKELQAVPNQNSRIWITITEGIAAEVIAECDGEPKDLYYSIDNINWDMGEEKEAEPMNPCELMPKTFLAG